jgi:hypothetical protein
MQSIKFILLNYLVFLNSLFYYGLFKNISLYLIYLMELLRNAPDITYWLITRKYFINVFKLRINRGKEFPNIQKISIIFDQIPNPKNK